MLWHNSCVYVVCYLSSLQSKSCHPCQIRLKKEQEEKEYKRRCKAQAHLYTIIKVWSPHCFSTTNGLQKATDFIDWWSRSHEKWTSLCRLGEKFILILWIMTKFAVSVCKSRFLLLLLRYWLRLYQLHEFYFNSEML